MASSNINEAKMVKSNTIINSTASMKPKYETVLWTLHVLTTGLAIVDRFKGNVWSTQSFTIGAGTAGNDRMDGFKEGPWSVVLYDILARVSGRFSIVCFNFMLITRYVCVFIVTLIGNPSSNIFPKIAYF